MIVTWWRNWKRRRQLEGLIRQTTSPDADQRRQAAADLAAFPQERVAAALVPRLNDSHPPVRDAASASLRALGPVALNALIAGLQRADGDGAVASAGLLAELRDPAAIDPLVV